LASHGFYYVYFPYDKIIKAFSKVGIDASFDESTSTDELWKKVHAFQCLEPQTRKKLVLALQSTVRKDIEVFFQSLDRSLS
jgi:hypothetical protein